jgi:AAA family ATP:ADP antiporter
MKAFLKRLLHLQPGEAGIVLVLGLLLLSNSMAQQVSGIVAVSGFLEEGGVNQILVVWSVDMILIVVTTALQSLIIDRFDRITLIRWLAFAFAALFAGLRALFTFVPVGWLNYSLLYLVSEQQWLFFPLVFWVLGNDVFDMAQSKRLFPVIASLGFVGKLVGIGIAAVSPGLFAQMGIKPEEILNLNILIYMFAFLLISTGLEKAKVRRTAQKHETVRETLTEGWGFVREVLSFRYLMLAIVALIVCDTVLEFRFLVVSDQTFVSPGSYQTFYSLYRLCFTLASFAIQSLLTSRIIGRVGLKNAFLILPFSALTGAAWMLALPGIVSSVGGMVLQKLPAFTVDESARKAFQALVPEERRGRVSMFMDSYLFAAGTLIGCASTGAIIFLGLQLNLSRYFYAYLVVGLLAALIAIWAVFKMRAVYDSSLFNWRLKRRQRGSSVLDKLDF